MKYDFTSILDRRGMDALAVDGLGGAPGFAPDKPREGFDAIPMWVADQNFPTCPSVQEAILARVRHPAFGYFDPREEYFDAIIRWQAARNGVARLRKRRARRAHQRDERLLLPGRRRAAPQPDVHRFYHVPAQQRLPHRPQPADAGRGRRVAHGL